MPFDPYFLGVPIKELPKDHPAYVKVTKTTTGYRGQIVLHGEERWVREDTNPYELARKLKAIVPGLDYVLNNGKVLETGELTLGECIEMAGQE